MKGWIKTLIFVGTAVGVCTAFIEFVRANPFENKKTNSQQKQQIEVPTRPQDVSKKNEAEELLHRLGTCF